MNTQRPPRDERRRLRAHALTGFVGFFAFLSVIQALINVTRPEPKLWPAVLALVLVITAVALYKTQRQR